MRDADAPPTPRPPLQPVKSESAVNQTIVIPKVLTYSMEYMAREDSAQRQIVIWVLGIFISILGEGERERNTKESRSLKKTECRYAVSLQL